MDIVDLLKNSAVEIYRKGSDTLKTMDEVSEWNSVQEVFDNIERMTEFLAYVAKSVRIAAEQMVETISNEDKLEAAVRTVKELIQLPAWVEFAGGMLLRYAISAAYQAYVKGR